MELKRESDQNFHLFLMGAQGFYKNSVRVPIVPLKRLM